MSLVEGSQATMNLYQSCLMRYRRMLRSGMKGSSTYFALTTTPVRDYQAKRKDKYKIKDYYYSLSYIPLSRILVIKMQFLAIMYDCIT